MEFKKLKQCPVCGDNLVLSRLSCPQCKAEFPITSPMSSYDMLSESNANFLETFLRSYGNLKEVQTKLNISYPAAKKRMDELLKALGFKEEEENDIGMFEMINTNSTKASDIVRNKLYENGGSAVVQSANGKNYLIKAERDGKSFSCDQLPIKPNYEFSVFDVIVDLLISQGGRARKGNGRNYKLGYGDCTLDTVVGAIGKKYAGKNIGDSVFDPVFVFAAILEWANIASNGRGYIELTADYRLKLDK